MTDAVIGKYTFRLFPRPSFVEGMGRLFDIAGALNIYNKSRTEKEADFQALKSDWDAVGEDIKGAIEKYESETGRTE